MKNPFKKSSWSAYVAGTGIGIVTWFTFLFAHKAPGVSTTFVRLYGFLIGIVSKHHVFATPYLSKYVEYKPVFEWQFAFVIGIFFGALISAKLSGVTFSSIPYIWGERFGYSKKVRRVSAIFGGFLVLFGARIAGGCTMGHGISGGIQLATYSYIFLFTLFLSGIITAKLIYKTK